MDDAWRSVVGGLGAIGLLISFRWRWFAGQPVQLAGWSFWRGFVLEPPISRWRHKAVYFDLLGLCWGLLMAAAVRNPLFIPVGLVAIGPMARAFEHLRSRDARPGPRGAAGE